MAEKVLKGSISYIDERGVLVHELIMWIKYRGWCAYHREEER